MRDSVWEQRVSFETHLLLLLVLMGAGLCTLLPPINHLLISIAGKYAEYVEGDSG